MGHTIRGVGRDVRALRAPPAPPSSPGLLPRSKAGVEQWLSCSLVSRSQGAEHRKEDGPSLHFRPASSPTAAGCPAPPSRLCLSHSPSSRTEQRDHPGGVVGLDPSAFLLSFGIFLHVYLWHVIFISVSSSSWIMQRCDPEHPPAHT